MTNHSIFFYDRSIKYLPNVLILSWLIFNCINLSLREARKDTILENRLRNIIDKLSGNVYDYTCLGVLEVHNLMFSFQMTINFLDGEG